jgi:Coenzyme PQQ synthesis protein D (PqqD)
VIPRHAAGVLVEALDDELVLYEPERAQGYVLNATAAYIWQQCDGQRDVADIASTFEFAYAIDPRQAVADVEACLALLVESRLLELTVSAAPAGT